MTITRDERIKSAVCEINLRGGGEGDVFKAMLFFAKIRFALIARIFFWAYIKKNFI